MPESDSSLTYAGIDSRRLSRAIDVLKRGIDEGALPGGVVCAARRERVFVHRALGTIDGKKPVDPDTIYDLASITKPMATASSVLALAEQGKLALAATLGALLENVPKRQVDATVHQLLTHASGLPAHTNCFERGRGIDAAIETILAQPTQTRGSAYAYSCLGFILLGRIVELVSGLSLDGFARANIFDPLGLSCDVTFTPDASLRPRIALTKSREKALPGESDENTLLGIVNDGNCRAIGGVAGNAGLFGTAHDVLKFGEGILHRTPKLFGAPTTDRVLKNQLDPKIGAHTLMFFAQGNGLCPAGDLLSPHAVGHSGFTGNVLTIDPQYDLTIVVLTNRVYSSGDAAPWLSARRRFLNALASAID